LNGQIIIPANDHLIIWCDEDQEQGPLHTNFKLSGNGEFLALVETNGTSIIDSLTFGSQEDDISYGRFPDGSEQWQFFASPTPGEANSTTSIENANILPEFFELKQNYPNPFNPVTTISYSLPKSGPVELIIYNNLGQKIETLIQKYQPAGSYSVNFAAGNIASGIYFYQLKTQQFSETRKMLLVK